MRDIFSRCKIVFAISALLLTGGLNTKASASTDATSLPQKTLSPYIRTQGISGNLSSVGSDTLSNMMTYWAEEFQRLYPGVNIQIQSTGSSTAPTALTERTADFGPMSRLMKSRERDAFERRHGYRPTAIPVAIDSIAIMVNKDNPVVGIKIEDVDAMFSEFMRCGGSHSINNWGQLGLTGPWKNRDIQLFGRNAASGTYGYFKKKVLCSGDYRRTVNEQPGSASVVQSVSSSLNAVGYSGIGYITSGVKTVPVSVDGGSYIKPTIENAHNSSYPLSRLLYVYVNKAPNQRLSPMVTEFIRFILSEEGQEIVVKDGYVPLSPEQIKLTLRDLNLE